jgi:hypothetical protein
MLNQALERNLMQIVEWKVLIIVIYDRKSFGSMVSIIPLGALASHTHTHTLTLTHTHTHTHTFAATSNNFALFFIPSANLTCSRLDSSWVIYQTRNKSYLRGLAGSLEMIYYLLWHHSQYLQVAIALRRC